ncbi:hypothetical protein EFY87_12965 [Flexivirga caeni]|uniref:Glycosyltransferase family 2 protein n=1 Tax=Flexivirga caeni TaxID=2294115 RepID=A0A3M9M6L8_9MICO|nr:hypothetical protein EFY87_12965 [Flexivirga caeni]
MACVLLTRFNLPSKGAESVIRASNGWLEERIKLFERYTVPSVRTQVDPADAWLVYLDPESPRWLLDIMSRYAQEGLLTPILREQVFADPEVLRDAQQAIGATFESMLTANLDNDDALAPDFISRLRDAAKTPGRRAIYVANGLIVSNGRVHLRHDPVNAFCAVREPIEGSVTCWADWHNRLGEHMPVQLLAGRPGWVQVVHGRNVSNRVRGQLVDPASYREELRALDERFVTPSRTELFTDRILSRPLREARDAARGGVRAAIVRAAGKDGLDRLKAARQMVSSRTKA